MRIIGDLAHLWVNWSKPRSARLLPVAGAKPGDRTTFDDPNLLNTVIQPLPQVSVHRLGKRRLTAAALTLALR
jgi:hypothetical protein